MNFLAHIYLSGDNDLLKIGNFMADSVHGKRYLDYAEDLQKGILLHRFIDTFTDAHPIYRQSRRRLYEKYGHYAGVIMDIVYDHFLAKNWNTYSEVNLEDYAAQFYQLLQDNFDLLIPKTQNLSQYKELFGIIIPQNTDLTFKNVKKILGKYCKKNKKIFDKLVDDQLKLYNDVIVAK
jgi:acyl carrier protein phosphodiesterase